MCNYFNNQFIISAILASKNAKTVLLLSFVLCDSKLKSLGFGVLVGKDKEYII